MSRTERTRLLLGDERMARLASAHVLVVGLGGVGAYAAEMLCRAGVGALTIIDGDVIEESNINRQLPALTSTIGQPKTEVMAARLLGINPELKLTTLQEYLRDERTSEVSGKRPFRLCGRLYRHPLPEDLPDLPRCEAGIPGYLLDGFRRENGSFTGGGGRHIENPGLQAGEDGAQAPPPAGHFQGRQGGLVTRGGAC